MNKESEKKLLRRNREKDKRPIRALDLVKVIWDLKEITKE